MPNFLDHPRFPFVAASVTAIGLVCGGALMAQLLNLAACPLCIVQRMLYLLLALAGGIGIAVAARPVGRRIAALTMAAIAATGMFVAAYQVWIQRFARDTKCAADMPWWERLVDWAGAQVPLLFRANGLCSDAAWKFLGLSIAEWSLALFSALLLLSLHTALRRRV
ncbi:MAG: hypothetical protein A2045_13710 [Rhodocyclales bacterium GWA2_65_20]|nr:MAG: hypothetical protein A2045_13710 [Rhodocyclales bacterium GWA2_65_20]